MKKSIGAKVMLLMGILGAIVVLICILNIAALDTSYLISWRKLSR